MSCSYASSWQENLQRLQKARQEATFSLSVQQPQQPREAMLALKVGVARPPEDDALNLTLSGGDGGEGASPSAASLSPGQSSGASPPPPAAGQVAGGYRPPTYTSAETCAVCGDRASGTYIVPSKVHMCTS